MCICVSHGEQSGYNKLSCDVMSRRKARETTPRPVLLPKRQKDRSAGIHLHVSCRITFCRTCFSTSFTARFADIGCTLQINRIRYEPGSRKIRIPDMNLAALQKVYCAEAAMRLAYAVWCTVILIDSQRCVDVCFSVCTL